MDKILAKTILERTLLNGAGAHFPPLGSMRTTRGLSEKWAVILRRRKTQIGSNVHRFLHAGTSRFSRRLAGGPLYLSRGYKNPFSQTLAKNKS